MLARPTPEDIGRLAERFGMRLSADDTASLLTLAGEVLAVVDDMDPEPPKPDPPGTRTVLGRAAETDDPLNAIVHRIDVLATDSGPLAGRRIAVKDSIAVAGVPMTCGSRLLRDFVPSEDAVVVERLLAAGARLVATTNMDDLALSGGGDTSCYGPVRNPFDPSRTAGGSSAGSAAILHYPGIDAAIGTDQGGSIRIPAAWCGVLGLKPTHGLAPYTGIAGIDQSFDHVGPLARTSADLAEVLDVIAGADERDPRQARGVPKLEFAEAVRTAPDDLRGLRIGLVTESLDASIGTLPEVVTALGDTAERLRELGASVRNIGLEWHARAGTVSYPSFLEAMSAGLATGGNGYQWSGKYWTEYAQAAHLGLPGAVDQLSPQTKLIMLLGEHLRERYGGAVYARAQNLRPALTAAYDAALAEVDLLMMPTTPGLPHPVADLPLPELVLRGWAVLANTAPTDMTGHPAISLPLAKVGQLPVGVMLVARKWGDAELVGVARTCERQIGWTP